MTQTIMGKLFNVKVKTFPNLSGVSLPHANIPKINLSYGTVAWANFKGAYLTEANFCHTNCSYANFSYAKLYNVNFQKANLTNCNLRYAETEGADLYGAILKNINHTFQPEIIDEIAKQTETISSEL